MQLKKLYGLLLRLFKAQLQERQAWLGVLTLTSFNFAGCFLALSNIPAASIPQWPFVVSASIASILTLTLLARRSAPSTRLTGMIYVLNTLSIVVALYLVGFCLSGRVLVWNAFRPGQLGSIMVALLSPSFLGGLAGIAAHIGAPLYQYLSSPLETKLLIPSSEVLATWAYGLAALFLLGFRFQRRLVEEDIRRLVAEKAAIQAVAQNFINIRDLMNTPLQTLEIAFELMPERPNDEEIIRRCKRSLEELQKLNDILKMHEKELDLGRL